MNTEQTSQNIFTYIKILGWNFILYLKLTTIISFFLFHGKFARLAKSLKLDEIEISSGAVSELTELERYELTEERKQQLAPQPVVTEEPPDEDGGLC